MPVAVGNKPRPQHVATHRDGVTIQMALAIYRWILSAAFAGVVVWAFSRKRKARFEKDTRIPIEGGKG